MSTHSKNNNGSHVAKVAKRRHPSAYDPYKETNKKIFELMQEVQVSHDPKNEDSRDPKKMDEMVRLLEPLVEKCVTYHLNRHGWNNPMIDEDACRSAAMTALNRIAMHVNLRPDATPANFTSFCMTAMRNEMLNLARGGRSIKDKMLSLDIPMGDGNERADAIIDSAALDPLRAIEIEEFRRSLLPKLDKFLNPSQRKVLHAAIEYLPKGYKIPEIAKKIGMSNKTFSNHLGKARENIEKSELKPEIVGLLFSGSSERDSTGKGRGF